MTLRRRRTLVLCRRPGELRVEAGGRCKVWFGVTVHNVSQSEGIKVFVVDDVSQVIREELRFKAEGLWAKDMDVSLFPSAPPASASAARRRAGRAPGNRQSHSRWGSEQQLRHDNHHPMTTALGAPAGQPKSVFLHFESSADDGEA